MLASHRSRAAGQDTLFGQQIQAESELGVGNFTADREIVHCVSLRAPSVPNSGSEVAQLLGQMNNLFNFDENDPPSAPEHRTSQPPIRNENSEPTTVTFVLHNQDRYTLGVVFYSMNRLSQWPGNNQEYRLEENATYPLSCEAGEKICFGAWRDRQTMYWGIGHDRHQGCQHCCAVCGSRFETSLSDGGDDHFYAPAQTASRPNPTPANSGGFRPTDPNPPDDDPSPPPQRSSPASCEDITPGAQQGPTVPAGRYNPEFTLPYSSACFVQWPGNERGAAGRQEDEQKCHNLSNAEFLDFEPDGGSNFNLCVFRPLG
jgi:hypothetical protein